jgi:3-methylcrotonyl-CoA carboxylase alpha subunit
VITAAIRTGAQAIHPGYGFLSENADFCKACQQSGITFIGPPVSAIEAMGSKSAAKNIMEKAQVPLVPGYHGENQDEDTLKAAADKMGYPVLLKATAGGGGKGMRQIWNETEFSEGFLAAKREAMSSFGDDTMLVEKYLTQPRHVEIQVFCDNHGNAVFLFERDCSVQRRHQKVIEEAPAFSMSESLRNKMGQSAIKSAQAIGYQGAGTVEFLLDVDGSFYFMEMNTRLQVEHPVTEMISGQDLVEWQLKVAANETLPKTQQQLSITGHAFEARIYAEDADNDFLPATGKLNLLKTPEQNKHVRIDTGVREGDEVSIFYDPMIAKLIVWDENREKALQRLAKALRDYRIDGVTTNIEFLYNVATTNAFIEANIDTGFIEKNQHAIFNRGQQNSDKNRLLQQLATVALYQVLSLVNQAKLKAQKSSDPFSPWHLTNAWRSNEAHTQQIILAHRDQEYQVNLTKVNAAEPGAYTVTVHAEHINATRFDCHAALTNDTITVTLDGYRQQSVIACNLHNICLYQEYGSVNFKLITPDLGDKQDVADQGGLSAPMNGTMVSVLVSVGEQVQKDQPLLIMEAMKMEHTIKAPFKGVIGEVYFKQGDMVDGGTELLTLLEQDAENTSKTVSKQTPEA